MAKRIKNNKGFYIIEMSIEEATIICKFGAFGEIICDECNKLLDKNEKVYYVPVLNHAMCKDCFDDWINYATRYEKDIPYEMRYYNHYANLLELDVEKSSTGQ